MRRSGPIGRSCLTCRKRQKKCDKTRPICERCIKGDFECLGYDCDEASNTSQDSSFNNLPQGEPGNAWDDNMPEADGLDTLTCDIPAATLRPSTLLFDVAFCNNPQSTTSIFSQAICRPLLSPPTREPESRFSTHSLPLPSESDSSHRLDPRIIRLLVSLPPGMSWLPSDLADITSFFMARFDRVMEKSFFRLTFPRITEIRASVIWRIQNLPSTRWTMLAMDKLFESLLTGTSLTARQIAAMLRSIDKIEHRILSGSSQSLTSADAHVQVTGSLEIGLFKLRLSDSDTYTMLRNYTSTFLQVVFSDSSLWPSSFDTTGVSLAHVLSSNRYDVSQFTILDMLCALTYGLPQLVEYDTTTPPLNNDVQLAEFMQGCPPALRMIFSDMNVLAWWKRTGPMPDWRNIERKLKKWQPTLRTTPGFDSWKSVAGMALQETWRHTLLIYLYMAVCGASSDEPRVAVSVRQVFQMVRSIDHQLPQMPNGHFSVQLLIAGAFSPSEQNRARAQTKVIGGAIPRLPLFNAARFGPVLDHLWHGAAANGRPIRWSDYVYSRQVVLPVETSA